MRPVSLQIKGFTSFRDEQRVDFVPTLWSAAPNVKKMVFPGAHADVGGGYPQGQMLGGTTHTVTVAEMPAHLHSLVADSTPAPQHLSTPAPCSFI